MTIVKCILRPPEVEAIQYTGDNLVEVCSFLETSSIQEFFPVTKQFVLNGRIVEPTDWIIRDYSNLCGAKIVKADNFNAVYVTTMVLE